MSKIENTKYHFARATQALTNFKAIMLGVALSSMTLYSLDGHIDDFNDTTNDVSTKITETIQTDINTYARLKSDVALLKSIKITNVTDDNLNVLLNKKNALQKSLTEKRNSIENAAYTNVNLTEKDFSWLSDSFKGVTGKDFKAKAYNIEEARSDLLQENKQLTVRNVEDRAFDRDMNSVLTGLGGGVLPIIFTYLLCLGLYSSPALKKISESKPPNNKIKIN